MRHGKAAVLLLSGLTILVSGCQVDEVKKAGPMDVRVPAPDYQLIALESVLFEGVEIGTVRTYRYEDEDGTITHQVRDAHGRVVGFVSDRGKAYKLTAFDGDVLIAQHKRLDRNVAVLLGHPTDRVSLILDPRIKR